MSETVAAIYEHGVLRPLTPLDLPEHAHIQIKIVVQPLTTTTASERSRVRQALLDAGIIGPRVPVGLASPVPETQLVAAARALAAAGPLSELIIAERDGR